MAAQALSISQTPSLRFSPGQVVMTCGVDDLVRQGRLNPTPYLRRHLGGDWGDLDDSDRRQNDAALKSGEDRLFSSYQVTPGLKIWIITEWDRSVTTLLLQRVLTASCHRRPRSACTVQPPTVRRLSSHHGACHRPLVVHAPFSWSITMSIDLEATAAEATSVQGELLEAESSPLTLSLQDFVGEFGDELLDSLNRANPPVYTGQAQAQRQLVVASLKRKLFQAQADVVHAAAELLVDQGERAAIVNGEMGCGKTTVGIATAAVLNAEGYRRTLVLSPPHGLQVAARIQETVAGAKVWVLNGPDTLVKLIKLREQLGVQPTGQEFSSWAASGCGWGSTGSRSSPAAHPPRRRGSVPELRHGHHGPRRRTGQPDLARSRGVPQEVQPLRRAPVDADPPA